MTSLHCVYGRSSILNHAYGLRSHMATKTTHDVYSVVCTVVAMGEGLHCSPFLRKSHRIIQLKLLVCRMPEEGHNGSWWHAWWVWAGYYGIQAHCQRRRQGQYSQSYIHPLFRSCSCCHRLELFSVTGFIAISNKRLNSTWIIVAFVHRFSCRGWRKRKQCRA